MDERGGPLPARPTASGGRRVVNPALAAGADLAQAFRMRQDTDPPAADDIAALQQHIAAELPLNYVDLRHREALVAALARWPWLRTVHNRASAGPAASDE